MTIDEFREHIHDLNDRLYSHWKFMNQHHPDQWPLEMNLNEWIEHFITFIENNHNDQN